MKKTKQTWTYTGILLIMSLVTGALAGIIASIITNQSLDSYMQVVGNDELVLSFSQEKPAPLPGTYEEALSSVYDTADSLAYVYYQNAESDMQASWLYAEDVLGVGVVVTNDGWVLFEDSVWSGLRMDSVALLIQDKWYEPEEIVEDSQTDTMLVHVDASGLDAVAFGSSESIKAGATLFALQNAHAVHVNTLANSRYDASVSALAAELYPDMWTLQSEQELGWPLFDTSGHFVGFTIGDANALPFYHVQEFVASVLEYGEPYYAALGVYGIDLEHAVNLDADTLGTDHGFVITRPTSYVSAVVAGGPADESEFEAGDIIVNVEGVDIGEDYPLAKAIARYTVGDEILIGLMREGSYVEKTVPLGEYDLVY